MSSIWQRVPPERVPGPGPRPINPSETLEMILEALEELRGGSEERVKLRGAEAADGAGDATLSWKTPPGVGWLVERIAITGGGTADVYVEQIDERYLEDFSLAATKDVADEFRPIWVPPNTELLIVFAGAGAATMCTANVQAVVRRVEGF